MYLQFHQFKLRIFSSSGSFKVPTVLIFRNLCFVWIQFAAERLFFFFFKYFRSDFNISWFSSRNRDSSGVIMLAVENKV